MRTLLLLGCAMFVVPGIAALAQSPAPAELLQRLPPPPDHKRSVVFTFEYTRATSKYKGTAEQSAARLAHDREQLEKSLARVDAAQRQENLDFVMRGEESLMRDGSTQSYEGRAEIAADFQAVAEKRVNDEAARWDWTIQRGDRLSEYSEVNRHARVSKVPRGRETSLSLFMETVGCFGHLDPSMAEEVRNAKSVQTGDGIVTVEIEHGTIVFSEAPGGQLLLVSMHTARGDFSRTERFEDYRMFDGVSVPMRVTRETSGPDYDVRSTYRLDTVEIDGEMTVPFAAAEIEADR